VTHALLFQVIGYILNHSCIPIRSIKVQILYQIIYIWQPQLSSMVRMLLFLYIFLVFHQLHTKAGNTLCQMMGEPKPPLLSKNGDITIGALFAIRSKETLPSFEFTRKPQLLSCSRFVTLEALYQIMFLKQSDI